VLSATEPNGFSDHDERRLCDFADLVAQAISNADARVGLCGYRRVSASSGPCGSSALGAISVRAPPFVLAA
jgi:hypothetical protein